MNNQDRLELINKRLNKLEEMNIKIDTIIKLLEGKKNQEPDIQFTKANPNADDSELRKRELEIFQMLDNVEK